MKNKWIRLGAAILLTFSLSGCVKGNFHVTVNKDGSGDIDNKIMLKNEIIPFLSDKGQDPIQQLADSAKKSGFTVSNVRDGDYTGVEEKKHLDNIGYFGGFGSSTGNLNNSFKLNKQTGWFYDTYTLNGVMDLTDIQAQQGVEQGIEKAMLSQIDMKFDLTLPAKAVSQNASRVIGENANTYEWDLIPGNKNEINLKTKVPNVAHIIITAVGAIIVIAGILFAIFRRRKNKDSHRFNFFNRLDGME